MSSSMCFDFFFFFFFGLLYSNVIWIGHGMDGFVFRGLNVVAFEGKSRMVLCGYGGGHGRVLIFRVWGFMLAAVCARVWPRLFEFWIACDVSSYLLDSCVQ